MARNATGGDPGADRPGEHETRLARGTLAQQAATAVSLLVMLAVITLLGRTLTLAEFGTYGLLVSISTYFFILHLGVEGAAVKAFAAAREQADRDRAFTTAAALYSVIGVAAAGVLAAVGLPSLALFDIPDSLETDAQRGIVAMAAVLAVGWPLKVFHDVLRGAQLFAWAAAAEAAGYVLLVAIVGALLIVDGPLWAFVAAGSSIPACTGLAALVVFAAKRLPYRLRRAELQRSYTREFLGLSTTLLSIGVADLVIYSLDRAILGAFRSAATVGLYEGPIRAHNLVRQIHGTLVLTVLPAASSYVTSEDHQRLRDLVLRGTRYTLAATVPIALFLVVFAEPVLEAWLGSTFGEGGPALAILVGYWVLGGGTGVVNAMLVASGQARTLARYAWLVAVANLCLSLALTPWLGLEGVVLGTTIPYVALFPFFIRLAVREFPIRAADLWRAAWRPAYTLGAALAAVLVLVRLVLDPTGVPALVAIGGAAVVLYWVAFYVIWLDEGERRLARELLPRFSAARPG